MAHALRVLNNQGNKRTLRIRNAYFFCTETVVTRKLVNFTFIFTSSAMSLREKAESKTSLRLIMCHVVVWMYCCTQSYSARQRRMVVFKTGPWRRNSSRRWTEGRLWKFWRREIPILHWKESKSDCRSAARLLIIVISDTKERYSYFNTVHLCQKSDDI